ncbi:MAG: penicillin acylase family protein [Bacteroidetes bacterium]|nr:penicillin acylase family protein [Bacteroidota bacterium]
MTDRSRRLWGVVSILLIIVLVLAAVGAWLVRRSFPTVDGRAIVAPLNASVDVVRDAYGMVHITASSTTDAYRALGYVHAQDRLWQMELIRRVGMGRLAEAVGAAGIPVDRLLRTIGLWEVAVRTEGILDAETRDALTAYAEGVNAHINSTKGRRPLEFDLLGLEPEPWTVRHSLLVSRLMAWELDYSRWMDVTLGVLVERFGLERAMELFPSWPGDAPLIVPAQERKARALGFREFLDAEQAARRVLGWSSLGHGSNSWVVAGSRTRSGKPILANDPHLMLMTPGRFHESHLTAPGLEVSGLCIPGVPFVIIGRNRAIAWGLTNAMMDDHDFYVERVDDPVHPTRYEVDGSWRPLSVREDTIVVRDGDPIVLTIYATHRGPVVNRIEAAAKFSRELLSMRWSGHEPSNDGRAFFMLNRATSWSEFRSALEHLAAPAQNIIYADTAGNIGVQTSGRLPIRPEGHAWLPSAGWLSASDWDGFIPTSSLPFSYNPRQGYIVTANNKIIGDEFPYHISHIWEPSWRAERLHEVLRGDSLITVEDMVRLQLDVLSPLARRVAPLIVSSVPESSASNTERRALVYLRSWDHRLQESSPAASIFEATYNRLVTETLADELGPDLLSVYDTLASMPLTTVERLLHRPASPWFDDVRTPAVESRDDIIRRAFSAAVLELSDRLGPEVRTWSWDRIHTVTFEHAFGADPRLALIFNNGPFPVRGSHSTVSVGYYTLTQPYRMTVGPSTRQVYDLSDVNRTRSVLPPGQSGQAFHEHYDDQIPLWLSGGSRIVPMDPARVERTVTRRLRLEPER